MYNSHELFALLLATGVLFSLFAERKVLVQMPNTRLLIASFVSLYIGFVCTVLEGFFWMDQLNILEHIANNLSIVLFVVWIWRLTIGKETSS